MFDNAQIYLRYIGVSIRGQMQFRASFIMESIGQFAFSGVIFLGIVVLFSRFDNLQGWSLPEVAFLYGLVNMAFAIADAACVGFDHFGTMVRSGDFDRLLLRPRSTALQLAGQELELRRVGRLAQGIVILVWASVALGCRLEPGQGRAHDSDLPMRHLPILWTYRAPGDSCILDYRYTGDFQHRELRWSRDCTISPVHLPAMVPSPLHVCSPMGRGQLFPRSRHSG